ncbi:MAG: ABC transporter ATP-binding protein [Clostridia bacterium]|nr:ABC transporter ATP-binding protein [Clostridia bacterium]
MELYIDRLTKVFKDKCAVEDVSLRLTPGIWGLLGANGAGKTTLMRMLVGAMQPTSGQVLYDGVSIEVLRGSYRAMLGYLPQEFGFYPEFTVGDYLGYLAALKGLTAEQTKRRMEELLERLTLADVRKKKIAKLSGGMQRRVGIAQALLNDPRVLILDEPTSGLDPGERVRFRNLLSELAQERIVLISTHIVSDIESIAGRTTLMKDGRLIASGTARELVKQVEGKVFSCTVLANELAAYERRVRIVQIRNAENGCVSLRYLADAPVDAQSRCTPPGLEDLYLWLFPQDVQEGGDH